MFSNYESYYKNFTESQLAQWIKYLILGFILLHFILVLPPLLNVVPKLVVDYLVYLSPIIISGLLFFGASFYKSYFLNSFVFITLILLTNFNYTVLNYLNEKAMFGTYSAVIGIVVLLSIIVYLKTYLIKLKYEKKTNN